ncbi:MAG TPA: DoxX family protein [Armatimonadota bacterium]|jgi:putative oxidoreductase
MTREQAVRISYFLLRVVAGLLFLQAGGMKLFGWFGGMPGGAHLKLLSQVGVGGILEFFGGTAILLGLFTRPVAFVLSGEMAVAYWQFHAPNGLFPIQNHGEPAVLLCFIFLYMAAQGGGDWSIDALILHRSAAERKGSAP